MNKLLVIPALLFLCSCIGAPVKVPEEHLGKIRNIGIISLVSENPKIEYVGFTIFNNNYTTALLEDWDGNSVVEDAVSNLLSNHGYSLSILNERASLGRVYKDEWRGPDKDLIQADLVRIGKQNSLDTLLIVYRYIASDNIGNSAEYLRGYGLYKRFILKPHVFATFEIDMLDVNSEKIIATAYGNEKLELGSDKWIEAYSEVEEPITISPGDVVYIKTNLKQVIQNSITEAINRMGIIKSAQSE